MQQRSRAVGESLAVGLVSPDGLKLSSLDEINDNFPISGKTKLDLPTPHSGPAHALLLIYKLCPGRAPIPGPHIYARFTQHTHTHARTPQATCLLFSSVLQYRGLGRHRLFRLHLTHFKVQWPRESNSTLIRGRASEWMRGRGRARGSLFWVKLLFGLINRKENTDSPSSLN